MKLEISVPEVVEIFKEIQQQPEKLFEMIRVDIREKVGQFLTTMMKTDILTPIRGGQAEGVEVRLPA